MTLYLHIHVGTSKKLWSDSPPCSASWKKICSLFDTKFDTKWKLFLTSERLAMQPIYILVPQMWFHTGSEFLVVNGKMHILESDVTIDLGPGWIVTINLGRPRSWPSMTSHPVPDLLWVTSSKCDVTLGGGFLHNHSALCHRTRLRLSVMSRSLRLGCVVLQC